MLSHVSAGVVYVVLRRTVCSLRAIACGSDIQINTRMLNLKLRRPNIRGNTLDLRNYKINISHTHLENL